MPTDPSRTDRDALGDGAAPDAGARRGVDPAAPGASGDGGPETPARPHRTRRRVARALLAVAGVLAVLVVGALVFLQTEAGQTFAQGLVIGQIENLLADDAEVHVERLSGNFLTGAVLTGLEIRRYGETVLAVDTVAVDYTLTTLLRRTFSASQLAVSGPSLFVRQRADSTFNVSGLLKPAEDTTGAGFAVLLDEVAVRHGYAEVRWLTEGDRDSVHVVDSLQVLVRDFVSREDSLVGQIEALALVARAPYGAGRALVTGAGRFSREQFRLDRLRIVSAAGTNVNGAARLAFGGGGDLPVFEANIEATPVALEDVRAFAGVPLYGDPRLRLRADSDGDVLTVALNGALDDATVSLDGEFSRETDGPVHYRAEGTLRRFNPAALTRNEALAAEITGDLRLNLQGSSLETLSGPFAVTLRESRAAGRRIDWLRVDGSFATGRVSFDLDGALPGASLRAEGSARPFDDVPQVQVAGSAQDVDVGLLLPGSGRTDTFAGDFALVGRGTSLDTFTGTLALDLSRADLDLDTRRLRLSDAALDATVSRGRVTYNADLTLAGGDGRVVASGTMRLGQEPLPFTAEGQAYGLNLAALTGNPSQESDLTGDFAIDAQGLDVTQSAIELTADLRDSRYGTYNLAAGQLAVQLRRGVAEIDADLDLGPGGQVTATGTARPFADPLAFDLRGTMRNLDLAEVQGVPERYSDLTGTFTASGAGVDPATMTLTARIEITEPSSYGERFVDAADLVVTLQNGDLAVNGTARTPEGAFDVALTGRPFDESPSFAFTNTCFSDLDVSAFAPSAPRSRLNGCLSGRIAGISDLPTADGEGVVTLRPSTISDAEIEDGRLSFTLSNGALGATLDATLASPPADEGVAEGGRLVAAVQGRPFDEDPSFSVRGRTETLDAGVLLDLPPDQPLRLSLAFDLDVRGTDPETMTLAGSLAGGPSTLGPVALDTLRARFALEDGVVRVDTLVLDSDMADLEGGGTLALFDKDAPSDFRLEGNVESLAPLAAYTEQTLGLESGTFDLAVTAEPGAPLQILGTLDARQLVVGEYAVTGLDGAINATWDRALPDSLGFDVLAALNGRVVASFDVLSTPRFIVEGGQATVAAEAGEFTIDGAVTVDERRDLDFFARLEADTDPPAVILERGRFSLDQTTWTLEQPARIALEDNGIDVRGLLLTSDTGGQQIAADGEIDFDGEQNFIVTVEDVQIGGLTDLFDLDALGGELTATLVLSGPATAPLIDGTIELDDFTSRGETVGAIDVALRYADNRLGLDAVLTHVSGQALTVEGSIPLQFALAKAPAEEVRADAEVDLVARADSFPIAWARPFLNEDTYSDLGGALALDLTVGGTQGTPRLDGTATLSDGRLGVVATGRTYEPIQADLTFQNNRIVLDDVRILNGGGRTALDVTGAVRFPQLSAAELDLTITPRDFVAMDTRTFRGLTLDRGSTPLRLTGTLDRPTLRGAVVLSEGDIYLTDELAPPELDPVVLTDAQIREVEARFGRVITARDTAVSRFTDALDYNLTVEIRRNVWLRSQGALPFDIEFEGDVQAIKGPFAESSNLYGTINLVRGTVKPFAALNRRFDVNGGTLTFNGDPLAVLLDFTATADIRIPGSVSGQSSVTVTLTASGQFNDDPTFRLTSSPSLEQADIVSLIATGRLASEGAGAVGGLGQQLVFGGLSAALENAAGNLSSFDVQVDVDASGAVVVRLGRYLTDQLFATVGYAYDSAGAAGRGEDSGAVFTLDYAIRQWLAAQGEVQVSPGQGVDPGGGLSAEFSW